MKIQSPWMGRVRGSAGNMTGSKVYDKNVLRAKAFEVSNPNTAAQQTERSFFAEVSQCVSSVSEAELRSLFGVKPKGMSRRNALTKQVSEAYSIDGTTKTLDFSKLLAIGNGEKVYTPMGRIEDGSIVEDIELDVKMYGLQDTSEASVILVVFNQDSMTISLVKSQLIVEEAMNLANFEQELENYPNCYFYPTCAADGSNVYLRGFGSYIIKTRGEK